MTVTFTGTELSYAEFGGGGGTRVQSAAHTAVLDVLLRHQTAKVYKMVGDAYYGERRERAYFSKVCGGGGFGRPFHSASALVAPSQRLGGVPFTASIVPECRPWPLYARLLCFGPRAPSCCGLALARPTAVAWPSCGVR